MKFFSIEIPSMELKNVIYFLKNKNYPFFLDSGSYFPRLGRYMFWGYDPIFRFYFKDDEIHYFDDKSNETVFEEEPFSYLEKVLSKYQLRSPVKKFPFQGGLVGFLSYELGKYIEEIPCSRLDDYKLPDMYFAFYDVIFVYDILRDRTFIAGVTTSLSTFEKMEKFLEDYNRFNNEEIVSKGNIIVGEPLESNFSKKDYIDAINRAKEYIFAGDIYQVNISQRFKLPFKGDVYHFYDIFRELSPSPFGSFLDYEDFQILSNSPERYLFIQKNHIETRPIKGTRPRGATPEEDLEFINELRESEKDKAEHLMIVDLERNDLGRIAQFNTVKVSEFEVIETYANVHHMVSTVEAKIAKKYSIVDCIKNSYPGGSITGAPKIRSMEIIDELEPTFRNVYTGSIGYIGVDNSLDLNISIRTAIVKDESIYFQVGGGIVADSEPEEEYEETIVKAESFVNSIKAVKD